MRARDVKEKGAAETAAPFLSSFTSIVNKQFLWMLMKCNGLYYRALTAAVNFGSTSNTSPTMP